MITMSVHKFEQITNNKGPQAPDNNNSTMNCEYRPAASFHSDIFYANMTNLDGDLERLSLNCVSPDVSPEITVRKEPLSSSCKIETSHDVPNPLNQSRRIHGLPSAVVRGDNHRRHQYLETLRIRREITKLLVLCLQTQTKSLPLAKKLAERFEKQLYQSATSLQSYSDTSTLQARLRVVLSNHRQSSKNAKSQSSSNANHHRNNNDQRCQQRMGNNTTARRTQFLKHHLGGRLYKEVHNCVHSIQAEKQQLVGQNCSKCQLKQSERINDSFEKQFPKPVQELFFHVPLVDVFTKYSVQRLSSPSIPWQELLLQAQEAFESYHQWKSENYVCSL